MNIFKKKIISPSPPHLKAPITNIQAILNIIYDNYNSNEYDKNYYLILKLFLEKLREIDNKFIKYTNNCISEYRNFSSYTNILDNYLYLLPYFQVDNKYNYNYPNKPYFNNDIIKNFFELLEKKLIKKSNYNFIPVDDKLKNDDNILINIDKKEYIKIKKSNIINFEFL